ncbi:MAG: T9SS type A sorting domain-containing protein [Desulfobulbaceae bacterium]|nr:T9SS type A sorting domain-containing protein [Desulfobulbaceae bacterium]
MKRFFYTMLVMAVFPALLYSQGIFLNEADNSSAQNHKNESELLKILPEVSYDKQLAPLTQGKFKEIGITIDLIFNTYYSGVTPFVYEPNSGTLIYVQTDRIRVPNVDSSALTGIIVLYTSQDGGENWQTHEIYRKWGKVPVNASIAVLNPNNETNPANFKYVISTRFFQLNRSTGTDNYENKGGLFLLYEGNNFTYFEYPEPGPLSNNPGTNQRWSMANMTASGAKNGNYFYAGGLLTPANEFIQYGYYGFGYVGLDAADVGSSIPAQFNYDQFKPSTGGLGSSFTSQMNLDVDAQGNVYAAVNNHFKPNTEDRGRVVGVAKSIDNGKTFSEFNKMSASIIDDFVTFKGGNPTIGVSTPGSYPYSSNGFRVIAEDEYSFIYRIFSFTSQQSYDTYIVEAYRKGGQWGMREISTFSGNKWRIPYVIQDTNSITQTDQFFDNSRQHEVQLAITADGQYLVAKWMDNRQDLVELATPYPTLVGSGQIDSMLTTDIFYSYRPVNGTQWSPAYNLTNDVWMNKGTWIPNIVPSINKIPVIEHATVRFTNPSNPRIAYPYFLQNFVVEASIRNHILVATFDGLNPGNIRNEAIQVPEGVAGVSSVDEVNYNFRLFNMSPNPVNNDGYINYQLDAPGHVTIDIHNSLGQKVMNVRNAFTDQGLWQANFSASELPAGAYFYTLTFNGKSVTKPMHIAR